MNLGKYTEDSDVGFIFEVDLEYPNKLHDDHNTLTSIRRRGRKQRMLLRKASSS